VQTSDWGSPIVAVLKPNGKVRLCGDFKQTVNPVSKLDGYPIPKVEDLFAKRFTKLDLSQAYQQLPLSESSKHYVVISTYKGLFRFNRLPYGILQPLGYSWESWRTCCRESQGCRLYRWYFGHGGHWRAVPEGTGRGSDTTGVSRATVTSKVLLHAAVCYIFRPHSGCCRTAPYSREGASNPKGTCTKVCLSWKAT